MAEDKKINLSVDDTKLRELKANAEAMAMEMIQNSRKLSVSSKEVLRDIEEQIKAIEKRNRLDAQFQTTALQRQKASGSISDSQFKAAISAQRASSSEDKVQTELLREIIASINATSKNEIRESRRDVEERISRSKTVEQLNPQNISARDALRETIQYGLIGDLSDSERDQRTSFRNRAMRFGGGVNRVMGTAAGSQNEFYLAAAALGAIPVIGMGLSALTNRVLGSAGRYESALSGLAAPRTDMSAGQARKMVEGVGNPTSLSQMGMTYADVAGGLGTYRGLTANRMGDAQILRVLATEKALGIDRSTMSGLAGVMRYSTDKNTISVKLGEDERQGVGSPWDPFAKENNWQRVKEDRLASSTGTSGVLEAISIFDRSAKGNTAVIKEMLGTFQNSANQILAISGNVSMRSLAANISSIQAATGTEGMQLGRVVSGIQGIGQTGNPVVRSMMLRALRQANPNASFFDLQSMMENPLGSESFGSTQDMFKNLKQMTGGGELYQQALYSTFAGQLSRTDIRQILEGGGDFTDIAAKAGSFAKTGTKDYSKNLPEMLGKLEQSSAKVESYTQELGKSLVDMIDKSFEKIKEKLDEWDVLGGGPNGEDKIENISEGVAQGYKKAQERGYIGMKQ